MFSRVNALGWALFETLTSAQMNALDIDHTYALDGRDGGVYNPTALLQWNERLIIDASGAAVPGVGLSVTGPANQQAGLFQGGAEARGLSATGGIRGAGARLRGGASDNATQGGHGAILEGGDNAAFGVGGHGATATAGTGEFGGTGLVAEGGAGDVGAGIGGRGVDAQGGAGFGTGSGGGGGLFNGGNAPGLGGGGTGLDGVGGTSVTGIGGNGLRAQGGLGPSLAGGGIGVIGIGAGAVQPSGGSRSGGIFKAGTGSANNACGIFVEGTANDLAAAFIRADPGGGPAVWATSAGAPTAVLGQNSGTGYGVEARGRLVAPTKSSLHVGPQDDNPSAPVHGNVMFCSSLHPGDQRMQVYQNYPFPAWQGVTTNLTRESVKAFASCSTAAGVITTQSAYNLTPTIVGAGAASRIRFTFALGFTAGTDYMPVITGINNLPADFIAVVTDTQPGYFEVGYYDISANNFLTLNGGAGIVTINRVIVAGHYG